MTEVEGWVARLPDQLAQLAGIDELLFAGVYAERTDYARISKSRVNQSGMVDQRDLSLTLIQGQRQTRMDITAAWPSMAELSQWVAQLRDDLRQVPEDPWLNPSQEARQARGGDYGSSVDFNAMVAALCEAGASQDLVGIVTGGPQYYAVCSSIGHRLEFLGGGSMVDLSSFDPDNNASKALLANPTPAQLHALPRQMHKQLQALQLPVQTLRPDAYRAWLAPEALAELWGVLSWQGFTVEMLRSGMSPLRLLYSGERQLHADVSLWEDRAGLGLPTFTHDGHPLPGAIPLIQNGKAHDGLADSRAAKEFGVAINGSGYAAALSMGPGTLPDGDVLEAIGTGLYLGHLWYANVSDPASCRVTAMTRYDCFWVEGGRIVGPVAPSRIDSSLFQLLGEDLLALGQDLHRLPERHTYGQRAWGGMRLPGALTRVQVTL